MCNGSKGLEFHRETRGKGFCAQKPGSNCYLFLHSFVTIQHESRHDTPLNSSVSKHQKRSYLCSIRNEITSWKKKRYYERRYCGRLIFISIPLIRLAVCVSSFARIAAFHQATNNERDNDNAIIASVATTGVIKRRNDRRAKIAIQAGSRGFDAR